MGVYGEHQNYSFGFRASVSGLCRPPKPSVMRVATTSPYGWSGKKQGWSSGGCTVEVSRRSEEMGSLSCLSLGRTHTHQMVCSDGTIERGEELLLLARQCGSSEKECAGA
ncbi:hypothetical protein R6Q59_006914 [Mikania micrantha]|uniref:Uncharacterized protein n=1 Tax=Mikania micrantha TaxID=192012 RepID=A0A5N6PXX5_9ASTR|nr:hypothetical protein E3N88_00069 [Mikania micrantha]